MDLMTRRELIVAGLAVLGAGVASAQPVRDPLLERAVARAGGAAALARVRALSWQGRATIHAGDNVIEIGASTRVIPFRSAHSRTWLLSQGPASSRALIIDGAQGWMERGGTRSPMPAAMLAHERQQYAIYALMLLVPARGHVVSRRTEPDGRAILRIAHPDAPETELVFDADGRLAEAHNRVSDPEGGAEAIDQVFRFSGEIVSRGVRWPRRIDILQRGRPYFTLQIEQFDAAAA
jgi:hypothetical protein